MRWMLSALAIFLFIACTDNNKIPSGIIPRNKMEKVLWDMMEADRYASNFLIIERDTAKRRRETFELYENVFSIHGITRDDFKKSYAFYMSRPDITMVMFDSISSRAERRKKEVYQPKIKKDSLLLRMKKDSLLSKRRKDSLVVSVRKDSVISRIRLDSIATRRKRDSLMSKARKDFLINKARRDSVANKIRVDSIMLRRKNMLKPKIKVDSLNIKKNTPG